MIYLTKTDEEKTRFLLNYRTIFTIEKTISGTSNIFMDNGKVYTVVETDEEIYKKVQDHEINIIKKAIELAGRE